MTVWTEKSTFEANAPSSLSSAVAKCFSKLDRLIRNIILDSMVFVVYSSS